MSENHELRLKIDAAAAKTGANEFQSAINAVKKAVQDLERDSTGAFTKLTKSISSVGALGKMKLPGVDSRTLSDLDSFAKLQVAAGKAIANTSKVAQQAVSVLSGLRASYAAARKDVDSFNASLTKVNATLARQAQLSGQSKPTSRTTSKTGTITAPSGLPSSEALAAIIRLYNEIGIAGMRAGFQAASGSTAAAAAAQAQVKATADAARAAALQERLELASAAAMRSASLEAARLSDRMQRIGDTSGIVALTTALHSLHAAAASDTATFGSLRNAVSEFANATTNAKVALIAGEGAERRAASAARDLATQNRVAASSAQQVEREMRSISGASNAVSQSLGKATGNMRGLENAFSTTFQVGSLFRNMLGSITLGTFTKNVFDAGNALDQFKVTMEVATGSSTAAAQEMQFIDDMTRKLGTSLTSARDSYSKFAISSNLAGVSSKDTQNIFESVSMALSVLGKGTEDQNLSFLALEQMMSKGTLSSEELRRQLGERLPGAVNLMAKALGVTTAELQKMLKAGTIQSADALPKFAAQLQKEFGPGLQNAMKRAGFSLGTLQGELQRLMETVAQSGFMQVLAQQFQSLTTALQGDGAREAAQKLGEGFASMAKLGGEALMFLMSHVNDIGAIVKAVFGGIVISQLLAVGGAIVGTIQQTAALKGAWVTWRASIVATTAATASNAGATRGDTAALQANAAASVEAALAARGLAAAKGASSAAGAASGLGGIASTAGAVGAMGRGAGALGLLSRALGFLGPVAMAASVALTVIPMLMGNVTKSADDAATKLDAALNRAGVSFDEFKNKAVSSATSINFNNITNDLAVFDQATTTFMTDQKDKFDGLQAIINGTTGGGVQKNHLPFTTDDRTGLAALGVAEESISKMGGSSNKAVAGLMQMTQTAITTNGSILQVRDSMAELMTTNPDTRDVLMPVFNSLEDLAKAEVAAGQQKDKMVNFLGSDNDKLTKEFVDMATQVVGTGEGLSALHDKTQEAIKTNNALAGTYQTIETAAIKALSVGVSPWAFKRSQEPMYDTAAAQVEGARNTQEAAQRNLNAEVEKYSGLLTTVNSQLEGFNGTTEGMFVANKVREYTKSFQQFQDQIVSASDAAAIFNSVNAGFAPLQSSTTNAQTKQFTDEVIRQYKALDKNKQTYLGLQGVMASVTAQPAYVAFKNYNEILADSTRKTLNLKLSGHDLEVQLGLLASGTANYGSAVTTLTAPLVSSANGIDGLRSAAASAVGILSAMVDKLFAIANASSQAAAMIASVRNAFANMFGGAETFHTSAQEYLTTTQREIELKGMLPNVRAYETEADKLRTAAKTAIDGINSEYDKVKPLILSGAPQANGLTQQRDANIAKVSADLQAQLAIAKQNVNTETNNGPKSTGTAGQPRLIDDKKVYKDIIERSQALDRDNMALQAQIDSTYKSKEAAKLFGEAMVAGGGAVDDNTRALLDQIDAAALLNDQLTRLADDPIKKYIASVPDYIAASQQIKQSILDGMTTGLTDFFMTGKSDLKSFVDSIRSTMAGILAQQTIGWGMKKLGMGNSTQGSSGAAVAAGGQQAGGFIHNAMVGAAQIAANLLHGAMSSGGRTAGAAVQTGVVAGGQSAAMASRVAGSSNAIQTTVAGTQAGMAMGQGVVTGATAGAPILGAGVAAGAAGGAAVGGGGGGGLIMGALSLIAGLFSEGGYSDGMAMKSMSISPAAFHSAPHYKEGTANTTGGGIPAILHPNEAVIPLSRGRKIPVEMSGKPSASENVTSMTMGDIHVSIQTDNVGNAEQAGKAAEQIAALVSMKVQEEMASQLRYGGMLNPRGR